MAEADPAPKRRASALRAALDSTPRPADAKHLGYGTAGFRSLAEVSAAAWLVGLAAICSCIR
eukprot:COSAG01_NODE_2791_length_7069_cov_11.407174_15_plen_62_part_00